MCKPLGFHAASIGKAVMALVVCWVSAGASRAEGLGLQAGWVARGVFAGPCAAVFERRDDGRELVIRASPCDDGLEPQDGSNAARSPEWTPERVPARPEPLRSAQPDAGVQDTVANWRDGGRNWPGLQLLSRARFRSGGLVIEGEGTRFFVKPKGLHGLRAGVNFAF